MKKTLIVTMLAAALLGGQTFAIPVQPTLRASEYESYRQSRPDGVIYLGAEEDYLNPRYETLLVDTCLQMPGAGYNYIDVYDGAKFVFQTEDNKICTVNIPGVKEDVWNRLIFHVNDTYDFSFDAAAQSIISSSADFSLSLLTMSGKGILFFETTRETTQLTLQGIEKGGKVSISGVEYTYVGYKDDDYQFAAGEIGFTGYKEGSMALNLVAKSPNPVPEPATGTLSLLALAGIAARRRRK